MLSGNIEVRCLLLALKYRLTDSEREWLRDALNNGIDWTTLVEMSLAHGVTGLLDRGLRHACADLLPDDIDNALSVHKSELIEHNEELVAELIRIDDALRQADIEALSFKGPTQAIQIYGDLAHRTFRDLDLLIHWDDRMQVANILRELGYQHRAVNLGDWQIRAMQRCAGQETHFSDGNEIAVEPHWSLFPNTLALNIDYGAMWRRAEKLSFESGEVRCLSKEDMIVVACLHGAKEQWWRLNWVCDLNECLADTEGSPLSWPTVIERARSQKCLRALLIGVGLANRIFDAPLADQLKDEIAADRRIEPLLDVIVTEKLKLANPIPPDSFDKPTRIRFDIHEGAWRKLVYIVRTLFAPRPAHIKFVALPPLAGFLYYAVRPFHDCFLLPIWRLWKAVQPSGAH